MERVFDGLWESASGSAPVAPEVAQFAFWIGTWRVSWDGGQGRNVIRTIHGGRVLLETFEALEGGELRGNSISVWDTRHGRWAQTWWDDQGGVFQLTGHFSDGAMDLRTAPDPDGTVLRMTFSAITESGLDWEWASGRAGQESFETRWRIRYERLTDGV
jgi:hypothetical protein